MQALNTFFGNFSKQAGLFFFLNERKITCFFTAADIKNNAERTGLLPAEKPKSIYIHFFGVGFMRGKKAAGTKSLPIPKAGRRLPENLRYSRFPSVQLYTAAI